ncbi:hypothetical protein IRT45_17630 [Nocardia sp. BSTN01]|uniref:hypothetical protein n=1 Tax=Nocardia sp. BSTN01 TaxID=2783665 RepID=UPI00188EFFC9|nr:hypothetical protein [Nocardia sp. BSTN01]MBF4998970.1 hypothetical protein [Nocardia sp. BSTN01]
MAFHGVEIIARGITARGARGCAFAGVSVELAAGQLGVVAGRSGSGRTSLLPAPAGRMARAEPAVGLDDELRVGDIVTERSSTVCASASPADSPATSSATWSCRPDSSSSSWGRPHSSSADDECGR